ncbi:MAG: DUF6544 family protein [Deltaproteobacteria bacterium]
MGFLKAFGLAELPQLTQPISRPLGALWLVAAIVTLAAAAALHASPRWWWAVGAAALVISQVVIVSAWRDAKFGTVANAMLLVGVAWGLLSAGPTSLRARYEREVARGLARAAAAPPVTEQDLAPLPAQVQRYLRIAGAVGRPKVQSFRVRFAGKIRSGPAAPEEMNERVETDGAAEARGTQRGGEGRRRIVEVGVAAGERTGNFGNGHYRATGGGGVGRHGDLGIAVDG